MAQDNSSSVAVVAIIVILVVAVAVIYFLTNGFQFTKVDSTVVQPVVQTVTPAPASGGDSGAKSN